MMKKTAVEKLQKMLVKVSLNSVGKSFPASIYERKIPKSVLKMHDENAK
ncbi:MAG: exodeoxyribonuclease V subunit alpha [Hungatella sp.]|jgi:hypothetical protein|nr:exodeoxyribonuclease V subunit alpha [Hungatella sp.]MDR2022411.1 exodeoxyribonuclease V subunit alpha [Hungatella sp.]